MASNLYYDMFSQFGDRLNAGIREGERRQAFAGGIPRKPDGAVDYQALASIFLQTGDQQGALTATRLAESQADDARTEAYRRELSGYRQQTLERQEAEDRRQAEQFRQQQERQAGQDTRQAEQWKQDFALRERNAASKGYDIRMMKMPDGSERPVRINLSTGQIDEGEGAGLGTAAAPLNPYATGKFNESQGKAANFADRIAQAEDIFEGTFDEETGKRTGKGVINAGLSRQDYYTSQVPVVGNELVTPEFRQYDQAARNFINANLRRESGAAISTGEFTDARKQYLPVPGDDEQTLKNKAANRRTVYEGLAREAGPAYRPPKGYTGPGQYTTTTPGEGPPPSPGAPPIDPYTRSPATVGPNAPPPGAVPPGTATRSFDPTRAGGQGGPPAPNQAARRVGATFGGSMPQSAPQPDVERIQRMGEAMEAAGMPPEIIAERLRQAFGIGGQRGTPGPAPPPGTPGVPGPLPSGPRPGMAGAPQGYGPVAAQSQVPMPQMMPPQAPPPGPVPSFAGQPLGQPPGPPPGAQVPPWYPQPPRPVPQPLPTQPMPPPQLLY